MKGGVSMSNYPVQDCLANLALVQEAVPGTQVRPLSIHLPFFCHLNESLHPTIFMPRLHPGAGAAPRELLGGGGLGADTAGLGRRQAAARQGGRHL